ncbi:MAG: radical SAM protein [Nitrospirae bacterium]|nr:radical SAM protein [Nitrospirota bacterium]
MKIREITAKSILSKSQIYDYAINPYVGCAHNCAYCYAKFMKRFTGHTEPWGDFVDVKINAPELLAKEIKKKKIGRVWISGVCDAYQPLEKKYMITKQCLYILAENNWPFTIQTKSPLVLRDIEILKRAGDAEVGFTITTADDKIRKIFEPGAPPINKRIEALAELHSAGIKTFAMIAPILPGAAGLVSKLTGKVDNVLIDRLNYHYADRLFKAHGMMWAMEDGCFLKTGKELMKGFKKEGIPCEMLF